MLNPFLGGKERRPGPRATWFVTGRHETPAGSRRDVEDEIRIAILYAGHSLPIVCLLHRRRAGFRIANMQVDHCSAGVTGLQSGSSNFLGGYREMRGLLPGGEIPGN